MPLIRHSEASEARASAWRKCTIVVAIASLSLSLASRVFRFSSTATPTVQSCSAKARVQQRDRDTQPPAAPARPVVLFWSRVPAATATLSFDSKLTARVDDCLHNRPPPV